MTVSEGGDAANLLPAAAVSTVRSGAEEALHDIQSMRAFAGLELGQDAIPDETTILNFRHLLEAHDLTKAIFEAVSAHLEDKGASLLGGPIMDATLIADQPSMKNKVQRRDPDPFGGVSLCLPGLG